MAGAQLIITGSAKNMVSCYHVDLSIIDVETTMAKRHLDVDIKYDTKLRNIIADKNDSVGNQRFGVGVRAGLAFEMNKAHEDMIGNEGVRPAEASPMTFVPTIEFFYKVSDTIKIQAEFSYFIKNGVTVKQFYDSSTGYHMDIDVMYSTIDIPLIVSWNFIQDPVSVEVFAGAYASLPASRANIQYAIVGPGTIQGSVDLSKVVFGVVAGFNAGYELGPGKIGLDFRFLNDFGSFEASGSINGVPFSGKVVERKALAASVGYTFSI